MFVFNVKTNLLLKKLFQICHAQQQILMKNEFWQYLRKTNFTSTKINFHKTWKFNRENLICIVSFNKIFLSINYKLFSHVLTHLLKQKWNKLKVIFINWQNVLNVVSPDSRFPSILTNKLTRKGSCTFDAHQFFVKVDPSRPLTPFVNFCQLLMNQLPLLYVIVS